jgi:D-alanine-D-alanine ligase
MTKISVLLVYGGQSTEHDVSLASARNVFAALDNTKYDISTCLIDQEGRWWLLDTVGDYHSGSPQLLPVLGQRKFVTLPDHRFVEPDVLLPILHGKNGEDGTVQGLAELLGIPCAGPSLLGAALTMDKDITKRLLRQADVPVVDDIVWRTHEPRPSYENVVRTLGGTVFVKPSKSGSSVGVSRATDQESLTAGLDEAMKHDDKVLIERAITGREIELAALGNNDVRISTPGEIISGAEFYSFDDKYDPSSTASVKLPAELDPQLAEEIQRTAKRAYELTCGHGMARIDFFVTNDGSFYLNEINSIPGFTNISMYPKLWRHDGLPYPELIERLIDLALE